MSCHTKEKLEQMLEDVVNEVAWTEPFFYTGTGLYTEPTPAQMVAKALEMKERQIRLLDIACKQDIKVIVGGE